MSVMTKPQEQVTKKTLSRERILAAAMQIADKEGIDALSMRKLAQSLGVEAMSLYNHIANKADLLDGLVEAVVAKIDLPEIGKDWRVAMRKRAMSAHKVLLSHPWATMLFLSRINVSPAMLRYLDATIGCLREAGFSYAMADHAWNALDNHLYGFTLQAINFPVDPSEYRQAAQSFLPMIPENEYPYMHGLSREVIDGTHNGLQDFSFGLDLILDGLEAIRTKN